MPRRRKGLPVNGWIVLDKPLGATSTQAVARVKRVFNARKAGHAGTLDPLATGLLPVALGEATKTVPFVMDGEKAYRFKVRFGMETNTDDAEGEPVETADARPGAGEIEDILPRFTGELMQVPPAFSAIRLDGARAYDLARTGEEIALAPRAVTVKSLLFEGLADADHATFTAVCGKGTYVRALARDMGRALGCFGHVAALRRTRVGPFAEDDMISLEILEELSHIAAAPDAPAQHLRPVSTALDDIPALAVSRPDAARLRRGQAVLVRGRDAPVISGTVYATSGQDLVALGEIRRGSLHPTRVFNMAG